MPADQTYYQETRSEMTNLVPESYHRVLEIGCGEGNFRQNLTLEHEYWGVELDPISAGKASRILDKVITGDYFSVENALPQHHFDLVVCNDVIEHIDAHTDFLTSIQGKLSEGGQLILSVPNVRYLPNLCSLLFKRDWRYQNAGILDRTHLRFFTRKSLVRTLAECGWEINHICGINRYGPRATSPKRLASYLGQITFGMDTAYMQFAVQASRKT